jgi:hypothetical protein
MTTAVLVTGAGLAASAHGYQTIDVTNFADTATGCSLREAVSVAATDANASGCTQSGPAEDDERILLPRGIYQLSSEIVVPYNSGRISIWPVAGVGAVATEIRAAASSRAFNVQGDLNLVNLTLRGGNQTGTGGAVLVRPSSDSETSKLGVYWSTITGGHASLNGGAIAAVPNSDAGAHRAQVIVVTSTISGNSAGTLGGGLWVGDRSTLQIIGSTIADNSALIAGGIYAGDIVHAFSGVGESIIGGNTATASSPDCVFSAPAQSAGTNLIGNTAGCGGYAAALNDRLNVDPLLAPLAANPMNQTGDPITAGAQTLTHALLPGSPAIAYLTGPFLPDCQTDDRLFDQRGFCRGGTTYEIGAYEFVGSLPVPPGPPAKPAPPKKKKCKKKPGAKKKKKKKCKKKKKKK